MKNIKLYLLSVLLIAAFYILFFIPDLLGIGLGINKSFPLGTVVSWTIFLGVPSFFYFILPFRKDVFFEKVLKSILLTNLFLGIIWGFVSFLLAGNWNFNFDKPYNFTIWLVYSSTIILLPILVLFVWIIQKLINTKGGDSKG
jgi:hypothetical protein